MFEDELKRTFLFRCEECKTILSIELDKPEDIEKKVFRRARRHFEGKNVVHRVVSKNDDIISFILPLTKWS